MSRFVRLTFSDFRKLVDSFDWKRQVTAVHVHHTWRPSHGQWQGLKSIEGMWRSHTQDRGFSDIAQHVTIDPEGFVWTGRGWNQPPASAKGFNGSRQTGPFMFEMIGDFDRGGDPFEGAQKDTALGVTAYLCEKFKLGTEAVRFHNELSTKSCPGTGIDRLTFLAEVSGRRPQLAATERKRGKGGVDFDAQGMAEILRALSEAPDVDEPPEAELDDGPELHLHVPLEAEPRDIVRGGLTPADRQVLRRHVVNSRNGRFVSSGQFTTTPIEVERIFSEHVPGFAKTLPEGQPLRLVFYAHGGLNSEDTGLDIARHQIPWWLANDVYPIFFVWETGLFESLAQMLSPHWEIPGLRRGLGETLVGASDALIEEICHGFGGVGIWSQMKLSAARGVDLDGATRHVVQVLDGFLGRYKDRSVELHAAGHSAGSIFQAHFLQEALRATKRSFETLSLLAPAIRIDEFKSRLLPYMGKEIAATAIFTMNRDLELNDNCFSVYRKSLLYLIDHALEPEEHTPILGLEDRIYADRDLHAPFGLLGHHPSKGGSVIWSSTAPVASGPSASTADSHGGFDDDPPTMNAVLRRVLGLKYEPLKQEFPGPRGGRAIPPMIRDPASYLSEPWRTQFSAPASTSPATAALLPAAAPNAPAPVSHQAGRRVALCVGIDSYRTMPLAGCVADARNWAAALANFGFANPALITDAQATRQRILDELKRLIGESRPGDVLVFQYSGHGTQFDDFDGEEDDDKDEAIVPVDYESGAYIIDDDFAELFRTIPEGVNLTCFFDCCHSGTNTRLAIGAALGPATGDSRRRYLPPSQEMMEAHRRFRSGASRRVISRGGLDRSRMRQVVFAACQPNESAWETNGSGDFTRLTLPLLASRRSVTHSELARAIVNAFGPTRRQTPELDCAPAAQNATLFGTGIGLHGMASRAGDGPLDSWVQAVECIAAALRASR